MSIHIYTHLHTGATLILFTIGPAVWHISNIFEFVIPKPLQMSLGVRGFNLFSLFPFPDESEYVCQVWSGSVQGFGSFPRYPSGINGLIFSSCPFPDEYSIYTCPKFVPDRSSALTSFPHFGICDPLIPPNAP